LSRKGTMFSVNLVTPSVVIFLRVLRSTFPGRLFMMEPGPAFLPSQPPIAGTSTLVPRVAAHFRSVARPLVLPDEPTRGSSVCSLCSAEIRKGGDNALVVFSPQTTRRLCHYLTAPHSPALLGDSLENFFLPFEHRWTPSSTFPLFRLVFRPHCP